MDRRVIFHWWLSVCIPHKPSTTTTTKNRKIICFGVHKRFFASQTETVVWLLPPTTILMTVNIVSIRKAHLSIFPASGVTSIKWICFFSMSITTGFLLGKFVADRQYRIRQLQEAEYVQLIRELYTLRKSIQSSSESISDGTLLNIQSTYNSKLWNETASCTHPGIEKMYNMEFNVFMQKLVDNELSSVVQCFQRLKVVMKNIEFDTNWRRLCVCVFEIQIRTNLCVAWFRCFHYGLCAHWAY